MITHENHVKPLADELHRADHIITIAGHITAKHILLAAEFMRIRQRRLQRLRIRMYITHNRVFQSQSFQPMAFFVASISAMMALRSG